MEHGVDSLPDETDVDDDDEEEEDEDDDDEDEEQCFFADFSM